jgi:catechol 2,3-dioxygenase-like lactoylglutathione lyase family enzyme
MSLLLQETQPKLWGEMQALHGAGRESLLINTLIKELEVKGVKTDGMRVHGQGPGYSVYLADPNGNRIELSED